MSLSKARSLRQFSRLGIEVNNSYSVDQVLDIVISEDFKSKHSCPSPSEAGINKLKKDLDYQATRSFGVGKVSTFQH